jgi:hypothetical protein
MLVSSTHSKLFLSEHVNSLFSSTLLMFHLLNETFHLCPTRVRPLYHQTKPVDRPDEKDKKFFFGGGVGVHVWRGSVITGDEGRDVRGDESDGRGNEVYGEGRGLESRRGNVGIGRGHGGDCAGEEGGEGEQEREDVNSHC